jgi:photoactive yellow protein
VEAEGAEFVASMIQGLDDLGPEDFDSLPFGAIQVDRDGIIHRYNLTESRLSGRMPERVIGRSFFNDVAPCTNIPGFHGRFIDGVKSGALDVRFTFVFDFHMAPVQVEIRMQNAAQADRYWILVRKIADLTAPRDLNADAIVAERSAVEMTGVVANYSACEREPIHLPDAIQPWGILIAADIDTLTVRAASANAAEMFGDDRLVGQRIEILFGTELTRDLRGWLARAQAGQSVPWRAELGTPPDVDLRAHLSPPYVVIELESVAGRSATGGSALLLRLEQSLAEIRACRTLAELTQSGARHLRALTGFERVVIYRFDVDWHGEVVAEDKVADWDQSFAGLHFPASDVPRQARDLYTRSLSRHVPDRDYVPIPVEVSPGWPHVDLSHARHRSVSPVHLAYHRNMGVNGSMSFSIMVDGRLWGLAVCHHRLPHFVAVDARAAGMTLIDALALATSAAERAEAIRGRRHALEILTRLMTRMSQASSLVNALTHADMRLVDLFNATGAAISVEGQHARVGVTPPEAAMPALVGWLETRWNADGIFKTESLSSEFPLAFGYRDVASGLLALRLADDGYVIWFRPEVPKIVSWGGDPSKPMGVQGATPLPRALFARWIEEHHGSSVPWDAWAPEVAISVRNAINDFMVKHLRHVRDLSDQLVVSNRAKSQFLANMSHELRTPLNAIIGFADFMLSGATGELTPRHASYLADIHASGQHLLAMVNDVLDLTRIDAGRLDLRLGEHEGRRIAADCIAMLRARAHGKNVSLGLAPGEPVRIVADDTRVRQILINLVTNAVKFTADAGTVEVRVEPLPGAARFVVSDTGRGMTEDEIRIALEPFRQVPSETRAAEEGTGLGLPIARSLAELHGGRLEIESRPGFGTEVRVILPVPPA